MSETANQNASTVEIEATHARARLYGLRDALGDLRRMRALMLEKATLAGETWRDIKPGKLEGVEMAIGWLEKRVEAGEREVERLFERCRRVAS